MGLLDRFKKKEDKNEQKKTTSKKQKLTSKKNKELEEAKKKKMFQSVGTAQVQSSDAQQPAADDKKPAKAISKKPITKEDTGDAYKILIKPLITEKITALSANNQYGFLVADSSNKIEIKKAISKVYGVTPVKVRIIRVKGKRVRTGKIEGKTKKWKKALITLKPGDKIEIYESVK